MKSSKPIFFLVCIAFLGISGCTYPTHSINQESDKSSVRFEGFEESSDIFIDGQYIGKFGDFSDNKALSLSAGTHSVKIISGSIVMLETVFYLDGSSSLSIKPNM